MAMSYNATPAVVQGEWKMAEDLFDALEAEALGEAAPPAASLGRVGQTVNVSQLE